MGLREHKKKAPRSVRLGILTLSSTRHLDDDESGHWMKKKALKEGHDVIFHEVRPDDAATIQQTVLKAIAEKDLQALILSGGTGVSPADVSIEPLHPFFSKELSAFGPLFAQLSFEQIDSAAIMSRATAGIIASTVVFCLPGSLRACKLACKNLIFPELGHLVGHLQE